MIAVSQNKESGTASENGPLGDLPALEPDYVEPIIGPDQPWLIVAAMFLAMAVGAATIAYYGLGIFVKELAQENDWGRATVSAGIALCVFGIGIGAPVFGAIVDRFGPRRPGIISITTFALLITCIPYVSSPLMFVGLFLVMGLIAGGATGLPYIWAIRQRFDRRRGLAFAIGSSGFGLGGLVLPQYSSYMLENHGWRYGIISLAPIVLIVAGTLLFFSLRLRRNVGHLSAKQLAQQPKVASLYAQKALWLIALSVGLSALGISGVLLHAAAFMSDLGFSPGRAAAIISTGGAATFIGRIGTGFLLDKFFAPRVAAALFLFAAAGGVLMTFATTEGTLIVAIILYGLVLGSEVDIMSYLASRYCPASDFGKAFGLIMLTYASASALSIYLLGFIFDMSGSYYAAFVASSVLCALAIVAVLQLPAYGRLGATKS